MRRPFSFSRHCGVCGGLRAAVAAYAGPAPSPTRLRGLLPAQPGTTYPDVPPPSPRRGSREIVSPRRVAWIDHGPLAQWQSC